MATQPDDAAVLQRLGEMAEQLSPHIGSGNHLLVVCQPKSGSTFLCNVLAELLGRPVINYADRSVHGYSFALHVARQHANTDAVVHLHALPSGPMIAWCLAKRLRPIILTRDIHDALVSMYEHKVRAAELLDRDLIGAPREQGLVGVAFEWAHWYIRFEKMWSSIEEVTRPVRMTYEELVKDPAAVVHGLCRTLDIPADEAQVRAAIDSVWSDRSRSNRNVGTVGRGDELPAPLRRSIEGLRSLY